MRNLRWITLLGLALASPARAWVWYENPLPVVKLEIDRSLHDVTSAVAYVETIRMHKCSGGYTDYPVNQTLNLATPYYKTVGAGDWCGVSVWWGSEVAITNGTWTVEYDEPYTAIELNGNPAVESAAMTPFVVTQTAYGGLAPRLYLSM